MRNRLCTGLAAMLLLTASPSVNARDTLPPAPLLELAFDMTVLLGDAVKLGETPIAGRNIVPIVGGRITGPAINGTVMPGGWDWQLIRRDGCVQIKADYFIKTDDGVVINVLDTGVNCLSAGLGAGPPRTFPVFEASRGKYDWLGQTAFVGVAEPYSGADGKGLNIHVYRVR